MIQSLNGAKRAAKVLVTEFEEKHRETIESHRKTGDIGLALAEELDHLRNYYLSRVSPTLTFSTNFLNREILRQVFKLHKHKT